MDGASAADRGDGVQRRLRQSVSLCRVFPGAFMPSRIITGLIPRFRGGEPADDDQLLRAFTEAARGHGLRVIMDLVVNHTSKDSELVASNPDWFTRDARGNVVSPFATDPADPTQKTVWGDLAELDYRPPQRRQILGYFQQLVRHYIGLGFGGFRCDAAYKVPAEVWRGLISDAKAADRRCGVLRRKPRGAERSGSGARRRRVRLSLQQRQMVGFRKPLAARAVRRLSPYRAVDRLSGKP